MIKKCKIQFVILYDQWCKMQRQRDRVTETDMQGDRQRKADIDIQRVRERHREDGMWQWGERDREGGRGRESYGQAECTKRFQTQIFWSKRQGQY